jgi:hypothetical protein
VINFSIAQYFDQTTAFGWCHQSRCNQNCGFYPRIGCELSQIFDVNNSIDITRSATPIAKTANKWETLGQACLTAIKRAVDVPTRTSLLALGTTACCLTTTRTMSTSNTSFGFI